MKKKVIILASALVFLLSGCGDNGGKSTEPTPNEEIATVEEQVNDSNEIKDDHYPVTIDNYNYGKEIVSQVYEEAPKRVLAVYQNSIETMLALGLEDNLLVAAGLDHEVKPEYKEAFSKVEYYDNSFAPDRETVTVLEPDMILSWYSYFGEKNLGDVGYWNDKGIKTYISLNSGATPERTLENEYIDISNLGKIFNVEDKSKAIIEEIQTEISKVQTHTRDASEKKRVLILEQFTDSVVVYGAKTLGGDMVKSLGAELIDVEGGSVGLEDIVNLNPDVIFVVYMDRDDIDASSEAVANFADNESLKNIDAIKNNNIYPIPLGEMYCSGVRTIDGITRFARGIYPELYE